MKEASNIPLSVFLLLRYKIFVETWRTRRSSLSEKKIATDMRSQRSDDFFVSSVYEVF